MKWRSIPIQLLKESAILIPGAGVWSGVLFERNIKKIFNLVFSYGSPDPKAWRSDFIFIRPPPPTAANSLPSKSPETINYWGGGKDKTKTETML
ncbi:hypothetical protein AVEN_256612-1 [Araneus ventricosus]|uniref:Uncharacterized protein n=1 Tax=Araneus ventricosus TaxID=182803 RepID=A0A4Y2SXC6_ARAVE|nr:hypothetical protein AVEN_256612-1 [Araneus ventricosus]